MILIFGLTACGKSTLAKALGRRYGLRVVHPSGLMRTLMEHGTVRPELSRANDGYWETLEGVRRLEDRTRDPVPVDVAVTQLLLQEIDRGEVVIDTWSLPWLTPYGVKIHLTAGLNQRVERAASRAKLPVESVRPRLESKDRQSRDLFLRLYGFDIFADFEGRFHLTIDTDGLSTEQVELQAAEVCDRCFKLA